MESIQFGRAKFLMKRGGLFLTVVVLMLGLVKVDMGRCEEQRAPAVPSVTESEARPDPGAGQGLEALIQLLKDKGIMTDQEVQILRQRIGGGNADAGEAFKNEAAGKDLRDSKVEEVREKLDRSVDQLLQRDRLTERRLDELDAKVRDDIAPKQYAASWAQKIKLSGDIRLRYQSDMYDDSNDDVVDYDNFPNTVITTEDRDRFRYRARLGLKAKLVDPRDINVGKAYVGLRIATGNAEDPVSTNQTMGDAFAKDDFVLDRAYLEYGWSPIEEVNGGIPKISLFGGRMPNPFFFTDLVWDDDLNFEGIALKLESDTLSGSTWSSFLTAGLFPLAELEFKSSDKWLYGGQLGIKHRPFWGINYILAVAYYKYKNVTGEPIDDPIEMDSEGWDWSVPEYRQKGNSLFALNNLPGVDISDWKFGLASEFEELNITVRIDIDRFHPVHIILDGDYVKNLGYDKDEIARRIEGQIDPITALDEQTEGYQYGVTVGYPVPRNWGEWNFSIHYKYLEADAVLDAFTDSDFHGGGTDAEGFIARLQFGVYKDIWLSTRYMSANEALKDDLKENRLSIDVFQVDLNAAF